MKPILYSHGETSFTNNGLGRLADCISCKVTEERNGVYECLLTYPVTGEMYSKIQIGCILGVIHDDAKDIQPFDIYAKGVPMNGVITFYAHHVSYRLGHVILRPMTASTITAAFNAIPSNTYNTCPFNFLTDKSVTATWKVEVPSAVKAVLGGQSGSILDVYGKGEYEWDKFTVKLHLNRGVDAGVSIRYGVNLTDINQEFDISETYNAVAPFWRSEDGTLVTLTEGYIAATSVEEGDEIIPVPMDLSSSFDEQPTETQLRTEALRILDNSEAWIPDENISVRFIDLAHTEEYKNVAALQRVRLCDKVSVYCGPLGVRAVKMQVIKTVYNVLTEEYDEIELGNAKTSFAETIMAKVSEVTDDMATKRDVRSLIQEGIDNATQQITGAQNSHVRFVYDANGSLQEIVVMDTDSINTAVKIWRWNSGGLGFSSHGYAGPYSLAMTQDGAIVATMITTGTLTANLIRAGLLQDVAGKNLWNLETGEFQLAAATTVGGSTVAAIAEAKVTVLDNALTQQEVFNRLTNNGATQGIYMKNGLLYINATYMDTGVLNADLITSGGIAGTKIANGAISTDKLAAAAVTAAKIAASAITADKIEAGAITAVKLAVGAVGETTIADGAITTIKIAAGAITATKIAAGAITADSIAVGAVGGTKVADGAISGTKIADGAVSTDKLAANSVTAAKIAAATITASEIAAGAITAAKIAAGAITADMITAGVMSANRIQGGTLALGGANNANGVLNILDASGNVIGIWNKDGISILSGSINLNSGVFSVTNAGALTATNASLKGSLQATGTDINDNTINVRIASGKIRMFGSTDTDGDVQSWQPHAYLYVRALGGYSPETSIGAFVSDFEIYCAGYLDQHSGTLTLTASDGDYDHRYERGNVTIEAADINFMDNDYNYTTPLAKFVGRSLYGGGSRYIDFNVPVTINSSFTVASGYTKSKVITTDQYADRLLYCYETPSPLFGDVGEGVIGDDGLCYVTIDPIFAQTITTANYQVFLQRYGQGDCYVKERKGGWFVVAGTPGLSFGWEIKGKQADVDQLRLERNDEKFTTPKQNYGEIAAKHIEDIRKDRETA